MSNYISLNNSLLNPKWIYSFYSSLSDKFTASSLERPYNSVHSFGASYGDHKRFLEFSEVDYQILVNFAEDVGIALTASAMDPVSVDVLIDTLKVPFIKIGSGDSNNPILLEKVAKYTNVKAVISTGMSDMGDVRRIYQTFKRYRTENNFVLLHCISSYPTPLESVNLNVILRYYVKDKANCYIYQFR